MRKNFLFGFSIGISIVGLAYLFWRKLSVSKRDQLAIKLDDTLARGKEKTAAIAGPKAKEALSALKESTSKLKSQLGPVRSDLGDNNEATQDDIVIDHRSAFSEAKQNAEAEDAAPNEKFYPQKN